jgi:hypothetical protein
MLDEAARWDDLVVGLRPMSYGARGVLARCLVSVGPTTTAKASSEGWRLRLRPNTFVLGLRKFVEIHTQHMHFLKILSTPVYKNNSRLSIKNHICPRRNIFFLVYLSDKGHRKNTENPSLELVQG